LAHGADTIREEEEEQEEEEQEEEEEGGRRRTHNQSPPSLHHTQSPQGDRVEVETHLAVIQLLLLLG
jgi:hypothetical protein